MTHAAPPREAPNDALLALLPWYVNGTLPEDDRRRIERLIQQSPEMRAEVHWLQSVRQHMRDAVPSHAGDAGLTRLRALIQAEQSGAVTPLSARKARPWLNWPLPMALAATFVFSVVVTFYLPSREGTLEPLSGQSATASTVIVQVTFKASAPEGEIHQLISSVQGEIVSGPGALGVYSLRVQRARAEQALAALRARKDLVDSVALITR